MDGSPHLIIGYRLSGEPESYSPQLWEDGRSRFASGWRAPGCRFPQMAPMATVGRPRNVPIVGEDLGGLQGRVSAPGLVLPLGELLGCIARWHNHTGLLPYAKEQDGTIHLGKLVAAALRQLAQLMKVADDGQVYLLPAVVEELLKNQKGGDGNQCHRGDPTPGPPFRIAQLCQRNASSWHWPILKFQTHTHLHQYLWTPVSRNTALSIKVPNFL